MATIKVCAFLPRAPFVSKLYFHQHYYEVHAKLAAQLPQLDRYVQLHASRLALTPFAAAPYDAVAQLWYASRQQASSVRVDPYFTEIVQPDERCFIDQSAMKRFVGTETVVIPGDPAAAELMLKGLLLVRRRPDVPPDEFRAYWDEIAPTVVTDSVVDLDRCVLCGPAHSGGADPNDAGDGLIELWWNRDKSPSNDTVEFHSLYRALRGSPIDLGACASVVGVEARIVIGTNPTV
jgi:hypothetical protein